MAHSTRWLDRFRATDPDDSLAGAQPEPVAPVVAPTTEEPVPAVTGLGPTEPAVGTNGEPPATPFSNFETTEAVLARLMDRDSPLMRKAAATGLQHANRRGLLNSSLAGQAAQSAMLDQIVPIASQTSDQGFRRGLQESEFEFTGSESEKERALKLDIVQREEALQREKIASDETIATADRSLRKTIASDQISANDRRGAESMINNAYRDYENALQSIMSNPDLSSEDRNKLLTNAKNMLTAKMDYATELYGTVFDWPENPFQGSGSTASSTSTASSSTSSDSGKLSFYDRLALDGREPASTRQ